jgi:hypothetical protein
MRNWIMSKIDHVEVANQFLNQYEAFQHGAMIGTVFTDEQMAAMISAIKTHPEEMCLFFLNAGVVISETTYEQTGDYKDVYQALGHYDSVVTSLLVRVVHILQNNGANAEMTVPKNKVPPQYTNDHDILFRNLDFKLPDWDDLGV